MHLQRFCGSFPPRRTSSGGLPLGAGCHPGRLAVPYRHYRSHRISGRTHALPDFIDTPWRLRSPISVWRTSVGAIEVHYKQEKPTAGKVRFFEERELLDNMAHRIGEFLMETKGAER